MEALELPGSLDQECLDLLLVPVARNASDEDFVRSLLDLRRHDSESHGVNLRNFALQRWGSCLVILLAAPNSEREVLVVDAIELHQGSCLFCSSKLNEHVSFLSVDLGLDDRVASLDTSFCSLEC